MTVPQGPAWLFVPADRPDRWPKAAERADSVIVDLENAVSAGDKDAARAYAASVTEHVDPEQLIVRVNARGSAWYAEDLAMLTDVDIRTVLVPKVRSADDLRRCSEEIAGRQLIALCETARSIVEAVDVASVDGCVGVLWGGEDLAIDLGGTGSRDDSGALHGFIEHARAAVRFAARSANVATIDAPTLLVDRPDLVGAEARSAAAMGYHAKACIHPNQVPIVRAAFLPTDAEVDRAHRIVAAAADHGPGAQASVFVLDGQMVDEPVIELALAVLRRVEQS